MSWWTHHNNNRRDTQETQQQSRNAAPYMQFLQFHSRKWKNVQQQKEHLRRPEGTAAEDNKEPAEETEALNYKFHL